MNKKGPLSILLVIDSLGSGGAQRQLVWLAIGLAKRGHNVALFTYYSRIDHFKGELEEHKIELLEVEKRYRFDFRPVLALRRIIALRRFDSVISFLNTPNIYTVLATFGNQNTRVVVSERKMFPDGRLRILVWMRYQFYRFADVVTVNSYHQRDRILRKFPWCRYKLFEIWNGVNLSRFTPRPRRDINSRGGLRIIAVATVVDWKNAYNLIKALALAKTEGAELHIDWAGRVLPTKSSRYEYKRCQQLIDSLKLEHEWRWLGVCENMHQVYRNYDALAHPSFAEGLPNVICEALATGLPVLAGDVCDHPLLIRDGVNGWIFDPGDPRSIADALLKLFRKSNAERVKMSHEARRFAEKKLGMDTLVDKYEQLLCNNCS
ncbi:MAG: glycosyltransferase [Chloroflexi bacterium]|nr:glycosyltransferase [Chloroflexota bacterium]